MNRNTFTLLIVCIVLTVVFVSCKQRANNLDDENDFDEFDNFDDTTKSNHKVKQEHVASTLKTNDDFDELTSVEEEEEDEKRQPVSHQSQKTSPPSNKQQQQQQQQQQEKKSSAFSNSLNDMDMDMEEFEHFVDDDEEFEGIDTIGAPLKSSKSNGLDSSKSNDAKSSSNNQMPNLKIADVPKHLMSNGNWQNYIWEIVMLAVIVTYFGNFIYGKTRNYRLVSAWYQSHRELLERHFTIVGDDGTSLDPTNAKKKQEEENSEANGTSDNGEDAVEQGKLIKDSENSYGLWCTGRQTCDGMLAQIKLVKRQDLINGVLMQLLKPQSDQIIFSIEYPDVLDSFVFCLTNKKQSKRLFDDFQDVSSFCSEKKISDSAAEMLSTSVANKYTMLNECSEIPGAIMDARVCAFLNKYPDMVEYLLVSDQYVGYKVQINDDQSVSGPSTAGAGATANETSPTASGITDDASTGVGLPKSRPILVLCLNVPGKGLSTNIEDMEQMQPALQLALYLIDKVPRIRLSKEAKGKALKKRKAVAEQFMKLSHKQRQEAAMLRKEEKIRAAKEKIMNEEDPEKQKRLEEKEIKREKKNRLSKMKQVKIKSM